MKQNQKSNSKLNSKLIFAGSLLILITVAFIFASGCVTTPQDPNYELQPYYVYSDDDYFISIDFYDGYKAEVNMRMTGIDYTTLWSYERTDNTIMGTIYQFNSNGEPQIIQTPMRFEIDLLNDTTIQYWFNGNYAILTAI